ncbi:MAG: HD-GYP domain-containing protein [Acidiferrobacterales bacterium]
MKKKLDVRDLELGMYISELDRPWVESPFLFQGFELTSKEELAQLGQHCKHVYIDVELGPDVTPKRMNKDTAVRMRIISEQEDRVNREVRALVSTPQIQDGRPVYRDRVSFEREVPQAKKIEKQTRILLRTTLEEVHKGNNINVPLAEKVVGNMVESVVRNPDALACLSQLKDVSEYTALHSIRTCILALTFGRHLVLPNEELNLLGMGALLHDIGMAKLPEGILDKPGALSEEEFKLMQNHIPWGLEVVEQSGGLPAGALEIIEQHHERHDGSGYVGNRKADMIGYWAAIGAIVDVYDAITSKRIHSEALSAEEALKRMYEWRHKDFRADLVEEFIKCMGIYPIGSLVELNTGAVGVVITINRARRLKPKVVLLLTANKKPLSRKFVADLADHQDGQGKELKITRVLPAGTYDIDPMDHIVQL